MATPQFEKFYYPIIIKEHHLDTFGHVNNATYLQIFEEARWEFISARGFGLKSIEGSGLGPTILECHIKFLREIRLREKIIIESEMLNYDGKIGYLKQEIKNEKNELCCEAKFTFGLFDVKARKLVLPTPEWFHAVGALSQ